MIEQEGFAVASAMEVIKNPELLPEGGGIYAVLIRDGARLLEASGYFDLEDATPWEWRQFDHLYTGETQSLRTRLRRKRGFSTACRSLDVQCAG